MLKADSIKPWVSLLAIRLPLVERSYQVLPVTQAVRQDALPAAVLWPRCCA